MSRESADSLRLFDWLSYEPADSLQLTEYHSAAEYAPGFFGTPVPYSPRTDGVIALVLLFCFLCSGLALAHGKRFLASQLKDFASNRERASIFDASTATDVRYLFVLVLQACVLTGVFFFCYFFHTGSGLVERIPSYLLLGSYVAAGLIYVFLKWLVYLFLGWTFFDKTRTSLWIGAYSVLIYYLGLLLFPIVLLLIYNDLPLPWVIGTGLFFLLFIKILMFYKWIRLFLHHPGTIVLLILYFCALEIVPLLMFYYGLAQINEVLLIKF